MGAWSLTGNALAASPSSFLGTTDNNALVIQTGSPSTERLRIDPSGNVGIGTATPSAALHVAPGKGLRIEGGTTATDEMIILASVDTGRSESTHPGWSTAGSLCRIQVTSALVRVPPLRNFTSTGP